MSYFVIYILLLLVAVLNLPASFLDADSHRFLFVLGGIALWRYGWGLTHYIRSILYRRVFFPKWRRKANALTNEELPSQVYLLVTTFRIDTETSIRVYREAIKEAIVCGKPATIVASIVEMSEEKLVKRIFTTLNPPKEIKLCLVRIPGTGKRDALAGGFRAISHMKPSKDAVVLVIDGDTILTPGVIRRCFSLFALRPEMGALTTDEDCELEGTQFVEGIYRRWYRMRFAQRHIYMSSTGLSKRVLTLTGRMSMFRASIVTEPGFINTVQYDAIDHWRLGQFQFLTGDDKSSWFYLLKNGWEMWYVPDVTVTTVEAPPHPNFFVGATMLMMRWFGNMLRTNSRALSVPIRTIGPYIWWSLIDQRISMWTSLFGLTGVLFGSTLIGIEVLSAYLVWIAFTRLVQTLMLQSVRPSISISYPFLLYFNQIYGSFIKIYMLCHLNRQKWTRQKTTLKLGKTHWEARIQHALSNLTLVTYLLIFIVLVHLLNGF